MADVVNRRSRAGRHAAAGPSTPDPSTTDLSNPAPGPNGVTRRRFMGYLLAAPTVVAAADLALANPAAAAGLPTVQPVDFYDLTDLLTNSTQLTWALIKVTVNPDGTVSFALPRAEVGQGITTAVAMCIADEMDISLDKVNMTLADADPALVFNQFTGGSNSMHSIYTPVRLAAAIARGQLVKTAAAVNGHSTPKGYSVKNGVIYAPSGRKASYADLAQLAAVPSTRRVEAQLKSASTFRLIGTPQTRIDQRDIVTGRKQFAMDLNVPNALPTMLCRSPDINGSPVSLNNKAVILAMPGVTDVAVIPHTNFVPGGVAVRAKTFGQCIDAVRAMNVTWAPGPVAGLNASDVAAQLQKTQLPLTPALPGKTIDTTFTFNFRPGDPLETNCAIADVKPGSVEVWASLKSPIWAQEQIASILNLPNEAVKVHVVQGGGSFGRHLFSDNAFEAVAVSKAMGKPVKLMWHRTDNFRQGRVHPMSISRVRATYIANEVLTFDQRHASVATDFSMGFGEIVSATLATEPLGNLGYAQTVFTLTQNVPYNFGLVTQLINEAYNYNTFNTSSVRNIYSPDVVTATELTVDQLANANGLDRYRFRRQFVRDNRLLAVLDKAATAGKWGRPLPAGWGQGIAIHREYKGAIAVMVEIDCTPATVNRPLPDGIPGVTGPRVTNLVIAVDVGLPINPKGLEAQMQGGAMDGIAQALTYSLHLKDGHYAEGSWDNAFYTRQWNTPLNVQVIIMPANASQPGGAGELACGPSMAAVACAYGAATKSVPTTFPINYNAPLPFTPLPTSPPIPQSPTDGLANAY